MICIEIPLNGKLLWRAGIENATMPAPMIGSFVGSEDLADLHVSGMCDFPGERSAHVNWGEPAVLRAGDVVRFAVVDSGYPTPPSEIKAVDSPEHLEEQREFEALNSTFVPPDAPAPRRWPAVTYRCCVNGEHRATATLVQEQEQEHILCSLLWNQWTPGRCRVLVRSFNGASQSDDRPQTEWLRVNLSLGESFEVQVLST